MTVENVSFNVKSFSFFKELAANNSKTWFAEHKDLYVTAVAGPMMVLARSLTPAMRRIDGLFDTRDQRLLSRPHRDVRFSKDKSPYHTAAWIVFRRPGQEWISAPAFFIEISATGMRYGMGYYQAAPKTMRALRESINEDPSRFQKTFQAVEQSNRFQIEGDRYAKHIAHSHNTWFDTYYQKRNLYYMRTLKAVDVKKEAALLSGTIEKDFALLTGVYRYLLGMSTKHS